MTRLLPVLALLAAGLATAGCNQIFRFEAGATNELPPDKIDDNFIAAVNATCARGGTLLDQRTIVIYDGTPTARYRYRCNPG